MKSLTSERQPLLQGELYNILDDLNKLKSDITLAQLLDITPSVRKHLAQARVKKMDNFEEERMNVGAIQLTEPTAAYSNRSINSINLVFILN